MSTAASDQGTARVQGIFHPVISVSDMDDALRFYRDILRLTVTFDDHHDRDAISRLFGFDAPLVRSVILECEDRSEFELVQFKNPRGRPTTDREMNDAGIAALALRVSGLDEMVARVHAGGFTLSSGIVAQILPDGAILRVAVCRAPDNVKVILVEAPAGRKSLAHRDKPLGRVRDFHEKRSAAPRARHRPSLPQECAYRNSLTRTPRAPLPS